MRLYSSADTSAAVAIRNVPQANFPYEGTAAEKLEFLARYAVLAPSGHNTQPWKFRIHGSILDLRADPSRKMPVTDPQSRELVMSCGAALLNLRVAMRNFGYTAVVDVCPDSDDKDLLARVELTGRAPSGRTDFKLFKAIHERRTTRLPFEARQIPRALMFRWQKAAQYEEAWLSLVEPGDQRRAVSELISEGDRILGGRNEYRTEAAIWRRSNDHPTRDGLPGYAMGLGALASRVAPPVINSMGSIQARRDGDLVLHAPGFCVLGTTGDAREDWMVAGQALGRVLLSAQSEGATASFFLQPIEVPALRERLMKLLPEETGYPQITFRLGYAPRVSPTPRRPLSDVLTTDEGDYQ